jgi:uncharacterized protein (DUF302 family)
MLIITTNTPELIEFVSPLPFSRTVGRLIGVVENAGLTVFARLDHAAGARNAGLEMPPSMVFTYGHARDGTAIMRAVPSAALDLPLRTLVRESADGAVLVSFHPIVPMLRKIGVDGVLAKRLEAAQNLMMHALEP